METIIKILLWFAYLISLYFTIFWLLVLFENKKEYKIKKLKKLPYVTIAIPAYNEEKRIKPTLKSVLKLNYPKNKIEFIIVNDGSTDKTKKVVQNIIKENKSFKIKLINQKNKGKGAALNRALKIAKGKFFVCLDADSYVEKNALKKILPYFYEKKVACVLPALKIRKPKNLLQKLQWFEYLINLFYKALMSRLNCIHVAPGPFSVYRTEILKKVGYFDENFNLTEDLEMALRLQNKGYKIIQLLHANVSTIAPKSIKDLYKQRNRWYKGSIYNALKYRKMLFNKNYGDFGLIQMPLIILSGVIALVLISSIAYYSLWPYIDKLIKMKYIDFDIITLIKNLSFNFHLLDLNFTNILVAIIMLMISIYTLKKAHTATKEKISKQGIFSLIAYIVLFYILLGIMWIGIAIDMIRGKKQRW